MRLLKAIGAALVFLGVAVMFLALAQIGGATLVAAGVILILFCVLVYGCYELQGMS